MSRILDATGGTDLMQKLARLFNVENTCEVLVCFSQTISNSRLALDEAPIFSLRFLFLSLHQQHSERLGDMLSEVLQLIESPHIKDDVALPVRSEQMEFVDASIRESFRSSLSRLLFGDKMLHSLRLRLVAAEFCKVINLFETIL